MRRDAALEFVRLVAPLVPPGKFAIRISGTPTRDDDIKFYAAIVDAASKYKAHRRSGVASLDVRFEPGKSVMYGSSMLVCADTIELRGRLRRLYIIVGMLVTAMVLLRAGRGRRCRSLAIIGKDIYA